MSERPALEARREELRARLTHVRRELERRHTEVDEAVRTLRAERDERFREVTQLESEAAVATAQLQQLRGELEEALREEQSARNHLWDLKG